MSEVSLGTTLLIWSGGSPQSLGREALGRAGSFVAVVVAMIMLATGMLAVAVATRLSRPTLVVATALSAIGVAAVGALFQDLGVGVLLLCGCALMFLVVREITRASAIGPRNS